MKWASDGIRFITATTATQVLENSTTQACLEESHRGKLEETTEDDNTNNARTRVMFYCVFKILICQ